MIGRSPLMWDLFARIRRMAPHYRSALITGPTGMGKDLTLFESELFGCVKGAFTGAVADKMGLVEFANGGTLFLDEIGDMPLSTQAKLLRVLQNQEVTRVGAVTSRKVDVRVVAATNRDMPELIAQKQFREDLYYRLAMVELKTPALAERKEDLPLLEKFILDRFSVQFNKEIKGINRRGQILLAQHSWPGNIRELENALGHACMMTMNDMIDVEDLPTFGTQRMRSGGALSGGPADVLDEAGSFEDHEKALLVDALERASGNQSEAARILCISRDRMRYKMSKYKLCPNSAQ